MSERARALVGRFTRDDLVDLVLALLMALAATAETLSGDFDRERSTGSVVLVGLVVILPLAVRRRAPLAVYVAVAAAITAEAAIFGSNEGVACFFGLLVGIYTVAAHTPRWSAVTGGLLTLPVILFMSWRSTGNPFEDLTFIATLLGGFWVAGRVVWSREQLVRQLAAQSAQLRRGRDAESRALVAEERARLARDVHDVVAHSVSLMVVQAEAGEALLPDGERSGAAFRAIQGVGRSTLTELRSLLGALGDEPDSPGTGSRLPSPRLRDAGRLVEELSGAGLEVALQVEGDADGLPGGVDLAAYRVLQESLTNALRHSGAARVDARVRVAPDEVVVQVEDDGAVGDAPSAASTNGTGRGLAGMRERVRLYGGEVESGPTAHGFRVRARIPLEPPDRGSR